MGGWREKMLGNITDKEIHELHDQIDFAMKKKGGKYWSSSKYGKDWYILELKYIYYQIVAGKNIRIHVKLTDKKTVVGDYIITIF